MQLQKMYVRNINPIKHTLLNDKLIPPNIHGHVFKFHFKKHATKKDKAHPAYEIALEILKSMQMYSPVTKDLLLVIPYRKVTNHYPTN